MAIYYNSKPVDVDTTFDPTSENAVSGIAVKEAIDEAVQSMYKPGGSVSFSNLPVLSADVLGFVYNITDAFTTDARFVEGAGTECAAGTNVVVVNTGTSQNPVYKFDIFASGATQIQSDWAQSDTSAVDYIKNKPTIPTVNDATLTISQNGVLKGTFSANSSTNVSINLDGGSTTAEEIMNANEATGATSPLKVWQGTEQEWTNGVGTDWYNWRTDVAFGTSTTSSMENLPWRDIIYDGNKFVAISGSSSSSSTSSSWTQRIAYSTDGINWSYSNIGQNAPWGKLAYGNNIYIAITDFNVGNGKYNTYAYSTDGENWTVSTLPYVANWGYISFCNGLFIITSTSSSNAYLITSEDGINWSTVVNDGSNLGPVCYGNSVYICFPTTTYNNQKLLISTDGIVWTKHNIVMKSGSIVQSTKVNSLVYGNGEFVVTFGGDGGSANSCMYTTDNGETWSVASMPTNRQWWKTIYTNNGYFLSVAGNSSYLAYSVDGVNWNEINLTPSGGYHSLAYNGENIVCVGGYNASNFCRITSFTVQQCYTLEATPTTASTIYSAPNTASALTITNIGTGTITLSDNNTYTYNQSGDVTTYQTIGDAYPNYLANINGVGVKVGNTLIADYTNTSTFQTTSNLVTSVSSASTDTQYPSAKLLYDTVGNIEATLDAIIAQGSNS